MSTSVKSLSLSSSSSGSSAASMSVSVERSGDTERERPREHVEEDVADDVEASVATFAARVVVIMEPDDGGFCSVCTEGEGTEDNPIVYCDRCNLAVHKDCYGYPLVHSIPDDEWICERCQFQILVAASSSSSSSTAASSTSTSTSSLALPPALVPQCCLCPVRSGAVKRTTSAQWAHLSCAQWIPEVFFRFPEGLEAIDTNSIPRRKYAQTCIYCQSNVGACTECSEEDCGAWFHVTCGMRNGVYLEYNQRAGVDVIVSYCGKHAKRWHNRRLKTIARAR